MSSQHKVVRANKVIQRLKVTDSNGTGLAIRRSADGQVLTRLTVRREVRVSDCVVCGNANQWVVLSVPSNLNKIRNSKQMNSVNNWTVRDVLSEGVEGQYDIIGTVLVVDLGGNHALFVDVSSSEFHTSASVSHWVVHGCSLLGDDVVSISDSESQYQSVWSISRIRSKEIVVRCVNNSPDVTRSACVSESDDQVTAELR